MLLLAMVATFFAASARETVSHDASVLPKAAQVLIKNNFKAKVNHIKIDKELGRVTEYDVVLTDGSEISFDRNGNWKEVEVANNASVPAAFVPNTVSAYVKQNQKNAKIVGIEKTHKGYTVELSNGVEMKFNPNGKFLHYDD